MKIVCCLSFLLLSTVSFAQEYDSLKKQILDLQNHVGYMQKNLRTHHSEFKMGTICMLAGAVVTAFGLYEDNDKILYAGGGVFAIGTVLQIDSHRFIKKAGIGPKK